MCQFKIGKGDKIRLWEDRWHINGSLAEQFPRLYHLTSNKQTSIFHASQSSLDGFQWNLGIIHRRRLYDSEIEELTRLIPMLEAITLDPTAEDQLTWLGDKKGSFSVKAAYEKTISLTVWLLFQKKKFGPIIGPRKSVSSFGRHALVVFQLWTICINETVQLINLVCASCVTGL